MSASVAPQLSSFALDVAEGLSLQQKKIPPRYFYDELGTLLFEAITLLPEYGLTRADERLLRHHARHIAQQTGPLAQVVELGSGTGRKTRIILEGLLSISRDLVYRPVDVSRAALDSCRHELGDLCAVRPVFGDWLDGVEEITETRRGELPLLLLFLGSSIGNLERNSIVDFLRSLRDLLCSGDFFLLGADLVKDVATMLAAYDDSMGITGAFNLNVLRRMNHELDATFDLRSFRHEARWNRTQRAIEMHLASSKPQTIYVRALDMIFHFSRGETIWTESSHKFTESELESYARSSGFEPVACWIDREWPFTEMLWRAL